MYGVRRVPARYRSDPVAARLRARDPAVAVVVPPGRRRTARRRPSTRTPRAPRRPRVRRLRPPQPPPRLARLALQPPEPVQVTEGEARVRVPVALPDDLRVREGAVAQMDVGESTAVAVGPLAVVLQADPPPLEQALREGARLPAVELDRPARVDRLRRVDADQPHAPDAPDDDGVAVDHPFDELRSPRGAPRGGSARTARPPNATLVRCATKSDLRRPARGGRNRHLAAAGSWQLLRTRRGPGVCDGAARP